MATHTTSATARTDRPSDGNLAALENQITELAAHIAAARCRLIELIGRYDELGGWQRSGHQSLAHWLNWRCGMGMNAARETVRVARALPELPEIAAAFRVGQLSFSKVRALTRVATSNNESMLLRLARAGTASHLERILRGYRRAQDLQAANAVHEQRRLTCFFDEDGALVISGRLPPEVGALLMKALDAARDPDADFDEPAANRADALGRIAESFLANGHAASKGGDKHLVQVTVNPEALRETDSPQAHACIDNDGACLSTATAQRIACDASLLALYENNAGEPLSVGRKTRVIPPAVERALRHRDRSCRFPGCDHRHFLDAHHIKHWAHGGETALDNLALLCRRHHRALHEGGFTMRVRSGEIRCFAPDGEQVLPNADNAAERRYRGNVIGLYEHNRQRGVLPDARTQESEWRGEPLDLHHIVSLLMEAEARSLE